MANGIFAEIMEKHGVNVTDVNVRAALLEAFEAGQRSIVDKL